MKKMNREEFRKHAEELDRKSRQEFKEQYEKVIETGDCLDEDGYPTDDALKLVEIWHWSDPKGWFNFIHSFWHLKSWGWHEVYGGKDDFLEEELNDKVLRYHISTAGWSGNETIIRSMEKNDMLWYNSWVQSRRGGHYIFELKEFSDDE